MKKTISWKGNLGREGNEGKAREAGGKESEGKESEGKRREGNRREEKKRKERGRMQREGKGRICLLLLIFNIFFFLSAFESICDWIRVRERKRSNRNRYDEQP